MNLTISVRLCRKFFVIACACLLAASAQATTLARLSLDQMAGAADAVARVRCAGSESRWENGSIWTVTTFDIVDGLKGPLPPRITVQMPGGKVGPIHEAVEGVPKFREGEKSILFLEKIATGGYSVTAWAEGTFRIVTDERTHRELVTQDSSSFAVFDASARTFRTEGIRRMPVEEFRARVAQAVARAKERTQ